MHSQNAQIFKFVTCKSIKKTIYLIFREQEANGEKEKAKRKKKSKSPDLALSHKSATGGLPTGGIEYTPGRPLPAAMAAGGSGQVLIKSVNGKIVITPVANPAVGKQANPSAGKQVAPTRGAQVNPSACKPAAPSAGAQVAPTAGAQVAPTAGAQVAPTPGVHVTSASLRAPEVGSSVVVNGNGVGISNGFKNQVE